MSFTPDELQSFHTILDQRLSIHRRDMERAFEQRLAQMKREFEQRLASTQQDLAQTLTQRLSEQQRRYIGQRFDNQQIQITQTLTREAERLEQGQQAQQQKLEEAIDRSLAAQLLAIEQLLSQHAPSNAITTYTVDDQDSGFEAIEVQTEVSWDDLVEVVSKAVGERISSLGESVQATIQHMQVYVETELNRLRAELHLRPEPPYSAEANDLTEVFASIEQLERIVESMQVAMAANQALLSNRLYHHQQLPQERAHPVEKAPIPRISHSNGASSQSQLPLPKEQTED